MEPIKRILRGFPKKEFIEHYRLFSRIRKSGIMVDSEEFKEVSNRMSSNLILQVCSLSSSALIAFYFQPFSSFPYPTALNGIFAYSLYRIMFTEHNYQTFCMVRDFSIKHNLKGNPKITSIKGPLDWVPQREESSTNNGISRDAENNSERNNPKN